MANTTSTLALCAVEVDECAVAVDMARCHVKLFEDEVAVAGKAHDHHHSHGHEHSNAESKPTTPKLRSSVLAMWVCRGRAFAALGNSLVKWLFLC